MIARTAQAPPAHRRFRLPAKVPPFNTVTYRIFTLIWLLALALALIGPIGGLYQRYGAPADNSQLVLGSRAGIAVSEQDATHVRFRVGPYSGEAGLRKGDDILAIYGIPLPDKMAVTEEALQQNADDPAYITMQNLLFGTEQLPVPLTVRGRDGSIRDVTITTGEQHIDAAALERGFPPTVLSFIDIVHVVFYPFLLWAAWILHRRNSRDAVSSVLSLAILLMISAEFPSSAFLASLGVPYRVNAALYDLNNVLLIAGIMLFPHGRLSPLRVALLCAAPLLLFLQGIPYNAWLLGLLVTGVLIQIRSLRAAESSDLRNQIRWALFGFAGLAIFRSISYIADPVLKASAGTFSTQLTAEVTAGLTLGLSVLILQAGLLVALIRYRLYDAEAIISRTASIAIVTLCIIAVFGGVMEAIITGMQSIYPEAEMGAAVAGAIVATALFHPLHQRVEKWAERRFQKSIIGLREDLPELMRDSRDSVSLEVFLDDVLTRIIAGVHSTSAAVILDGKVRQAVGIATPEVEHWLATVKPQDDEEVLDCVPEDHVFPLRMQIQTSAGHFGWLLVGPRPDGSIAGKDEQEALENVAALLARSIRIILSREAEKQELMALLDAQGQRIGKLERLLKVKS